MNDDDTPETLDLEEGDSIEVALERESWKSVGPREKALTSRHNWVFGFHRGRWMLNDRRS